ncbi:RES family NAD+ phosphorylase [Erythrobacter sp. EC-HK427]|uniref:RES family NAD+ phosphorylase n=1 Tax=Erythrobacter sp. EC-HK427 TaxID=2038396 RepID=UPI0012566DA9|nr:RES family NAD+ phosphorylase [Erythrobacter sp. EC-HK427]VVT18527.1 conserved hypothetical protein [Erythrobacter sp. EC-HK427]
MSIPVNRVRWTSAYRIIPSRFPPIGLFEKVADPADLEAVFELEAMTNDRIRDEVGDITLVPPEDRVSGLGSSPIMAAFTHLRPGGDRFADGSHGAFYCAKSLDTAIAETKYHRTRFLAATNEPPQEVDMRVYRVAFDTRLHDIRGRQQRMADIYAPNDYAASQALGRKLRGEGANGLVYSSVRHTGGECAALFRPRMVRECTQERHLAYVWDGNAITMVYVRSLLD